MGAEREQQTAVYQLGIGRQSPILGFNAYLSSFENEDENEDEDDF